MRKMLATAWLMAAIFGAGSQPAFAELQNICEREMVAAAQKYQVPLAVLYAVGLTKTGRRNVLYPHALNIEGKSVLPPNRAAAEKDIIAARDLGKKFIDIGCMQINHHYHGDQFQSELLMLEPQANVQYAASLLKKLRKRQGSWTMAIALYHANPNDDRPQKLHVCNAIRSMVTLGFGNWTKKSKQFCDA